MISPENARLMANKVMQQDSRAIARLISMIESGDPKRIPLLNFLDQNNGKAHVIGVTGPPGAGKSTMTDKLVKELRVRGYSVAVLAVDPSSPFTGGAILGDRIRMQQHALDSMVFIRSLATRGHLGGLSRAVAESARLLNSAGYDYIIIETVGVGQSEIDIVRIADTIILVSVPGLGDDIQAIKAGVMEIGDIFIVNKADREGAERVSREIKVMLETAVLNNAVTRFTPLYKKLFNNTEQENTSRKNIDKSNLEQGAFHHIASQAPASALENHPQIRIPPVLSTIAESGKGIPELVDAILEHKKALIDSGFISKRREENLAWELEKSIADKFLASIKKADNGKAIALLAHSVLQKDVSFYEAMDSIERNFDIKGQIHKGENSVIKA